MNDRTRAVFRGRKRRAGCQAHLCQLLKADTFASKTSKGFASSRLPVRVLDEMYDIVVPQVEISWDFRPGMLQARCSWVRMFNEWLKERKMYELRQREAVSALHCDVRSHAYITLDLQADLFGPRVTMPYYPPFDMGSFSSSFKQTTECQDPDLGTASSKADFLIRIVKDRYGNRVWGKLPLGRNRISIICQRLLRGWSLRLTRVTKLERRKLGRL